MSAQHHPGTSKTAPSVVTELMVNGMTCSNCARHVTEAIQGVPGVRSASVVLDAGRASVRWASDAPANVAGILAAVRSAGYAAKPIRADAPGNGGHKLAGWQANLWLGVFGTTPLMLGEWLFGLGMARWFQWVSFALAGMVQVFAGARFYAGAWRQLKTGGSNMDTLVALGSTTAFGYSAWALLAGWPGHLYFMEAAAIITIISVGHWIETRVSARASTALRSLLQLAPQTARRVAPDRAGLPIGQDAQQRIPAGLEVEIPVAELRIGDLIALRPGDRVPTDGIVVGGESAVDESMLTGESVPVDKTAGGELYTGTVNVNGRLIMRVTATGEATALAQIVATVQHAQSSRANIQRLGDRISSVFVPAVVLIALAAAVWWGLAPDSAKQVHVWLSPFLWPAHPPIGASAGFIIAAAVLIVACPCAMGLATPAAIMAGSNAGAARGILIRDGVALEKAGNITSVVFDKTGTLTIGKPEVAAMLYKMGNTLVQDVPAPPHPDLLPAEKGRGEGKDVVHIAAALARHSTHPVSQAVAKISTGEVQVADWKEVHGGGVEANIQHPTSSARPSMVAARLGSLRWLHEAGVDLGAGEAFSAEWSAKGATIVGFAIGSDLAALFAVKDTVKPGAKKVITQLQRQGLNIYLLTGDSRLTAAGIAGQTGIDLDRVFAEVRPGQKAEWVKKLQQQGERVAFVGDGINDAPALEQADLGIAVSRASDIAREAADIILLKTEIEAVPESLGLARATLRTIKQNLFWAFFYNAAAVPLAAFGFLSPVLCAAAMGLSDLVVIGNALRLRRWRLETGIS